MTSATFPLNAGRLLNLAKSHKLPVILQSEASECGLACLAMVANFHGYECDLTTLRRQHAISSQGMTLKHLINVAAQLHLSPRPLKLELTDLANLATPCILHWQMQHFVVLKKVTATYLVVHDPARGERHVEISEVDSAFTGIALELLPTPEFIPQKQRQRMSIGHFWSRIVGLKRSLAVILLLSVLLQVFALLSPYYLQTVVDDVVLRTDHNLLMVLAIGFAILLVIEAITGLFRQLSILTLSSHLNLQMSANVFHHLIRLPLDYFAKRHMGDVVSRFASLQHIRELLTTGLVTVIIDGLMALITLVVMCFYSKLLALIAVVVVLIYGAMRYFFYPPFKRLHEESIAAAAKENSFFMESVRAMQTIKLFEKEADRQSQWQNHLAEYMNKDIRIRTWGFSFETGNKLLFGLENVIIIYLAATLVMGNVLSVGMLYAFISYKSRFISAMDNLIGKWIEFKMLEVHFSRLADIVYTPQDHTFSSVGANPNAALTNTSPQESGCRDVAMHLQATNLSYRFSAADAPVFDIAELSVSQGETVAIIGTSGCGKSTLLKNLMGLYQPSAGRICINGIPLAQVPHYRKSIAAIMQDDQLLSGSILENIGCFDEQIDQQRVIRVAQLACIHEEILRMGMQYNTLVGDMGASLSGGQKQRLLLARALYKEPQLLFMDEATSHLDVNTEAQVNGNIQAMKITRLIVAHRPATISSADRILQLANGRLSDVTSTFKPTH